MDEDDELGDGLFVPCHACGHKGWFHPEMTAPDDAAIFCEECGADFGRWTDLRSRLFTASDMLSATLAKRL